MAGRPFGMAAPRNRLERQRRLGELSPEEAPLLIARLDQVDLALGGEAVDEVRVGDLGPEVQAALRRRAVADGLGAAVALEDGALDRLPGALEGLARAGGGRRAGTAADPPAAVLRQ
jgi:hypothetical protein